LGGGEGGRAFESLCVLASFFCLSFIYDSRTHTLIYFYFPPFFASLNRNKKYFILCDDLPRVEVLKELCETIYLARMYKNLALEEELYRELIDIYRRPESGIFQRTGPYRHWLREADEDKSDYDRIVREGLEKYR